VLAELNMMIRNVRGSRRKRVINSLANFPLEVKLVPQLSARFSSFAMELPIQYDNVTVMGAIAAGNSVVLKVRRKCLKPDGYSGK
jgi:hypothetical protein